MTPSSDIVRLVEIMERLRDAASGCPWDIEQTPQTIIPYTIEETYEVVDAIENGDAVDLCEELGDLLLQVVYHAQFATERGDFTFADVVLGITRKMIRRHPHVFGDEDARSASSAKGAWERIKAEERRERAAAKAASGVAVARQLPRYLDAVPRSMPPSLEALKLQQRLAKVGFDWTETAPILAKLDEEIEELKHELATSGDGVQGELGDVLFVLVNLARRLEIDADRALYETNTKVRDRFAAVEAILARDGLSLDDATLEQMDAAWDEAKRGQLSGS